MKSKTIKISMAVAALAVLTGSVMALEKMKPSSGVATVSAQDKLQAEIICVSNCNDLQQCRNSIESRDEFGKIWLSQATVGASK